MLLESLPCCTAFKVFFFNDTATTEIYTLSLHDALPISHHRESVRRPSIPRTHCGRIPRCGPAGLPTQPSRRPLGFLSDRKVGRAHARLQSQSNFVCRLLLEKKKGSPPTFSFW